MKLIVRHYKEKFSFTGSLSQFSDFQTSCPRRFQFQWASGMSLSDIQICWTTTIWYNLFLIIIMLNQIIIKYTSQSIILYRYIVSMLLFLIISVCGLLMFKLMYITTPFSISKNQIPCFLLLATKHYTLPSQSSQVSICTPSHPGATSPTTRSHKSPPPPTTVSRHAHQRVPGRRPTKKSRMWWSTVDGRIFLHQLIW